MNNYTKIILVTIVILLISVMIYFTFKSTSNSNNILIKTDTIIMTKYDTIYLERNNVKLFERLQKPVTVAIQRDTIQRDTRQRAVESILSIENNSDGLSVISKNEKESIIKQYDFGNMINRGFSIISDSGNIILKKQMLMIEGPEVFTRYDFTQKQYYLGTRIGVNWDDQYRINASIINEGKEKKIRAEIEFSYRIKF